LLAWGSRYYFTVEAPNLPYWQSPPPIISNAGWYNGQGNSDTEPTADKNFWVADYGVDQWSLGPMQKLGYRKTNRKGKLTEGSVAKTGEIFVKR
jgi:hypothetical protein